MPYPIRTLSVRGPFGGLNDSENPFLVRDEQLTLAQNVVFDDGGLTKVRGTSAYGNAVATSTTTWGIHDFVSRDGTRQFIRMLQTGGGTALYVYNTGTANWDIKGSAGDYGSALASFVTWPAGGAAGKSFLFIADKSGTLRKKWDGTNLTTWGIATPSAGVPTGASNRDGGATVGATYYFKYTYYNSVSGEESNPTAASVGVVCAANPNDAFTVTIPQYAGYDANLFDKVRVYSTTGNGSVYYLADEILCTGASHADATGLAAGNITAHVLASTSSTGYTTDTALAAGGNILETDNDQPLGMKYIVAHKERIFGAGASANPQYLYYSKLSEPENWPTLNFIQTYNPQQGGLTDITGLLPFRDHLYIFSHDQMWTLRGTDATDFILERQPHGVGCVSHHTIKAFQNVVLWWSEAGPVLWDGASFQFPGKGKIDSLMRWTAANSTDWTNAGSPNGIDPDRMDSMVSELFKVGGRLQYWTAYTSRTGSTNDRILVYDLASAAWSIIVVPAASMGIVENATTDMDQFYLGGYTGTIREAWRGFTFETAAINAQADTRWFDMGSPGHRKKLRGLRLWLRAYDPSLSAHNLTVRWYFDFSSTAAGSTAVAVPATRTRPIYFHLRGKFQHVKFRFENTAASQDFTLDGYDIEYRPQAALQEVAP